MRRLKVEFTESSLTVTGDSLASVLYAASYCINEDTENYYRSEDDPVLFESDIKTATVSRGASSDPEDKTWRFIAIKT